MLTAEFLESIHGIAAAEWDGLFATTNPFVQHRFLGALEDSGAVGGDSGWTPLHLVLRNGSAARAAMPLYLKDHSYGEFVFDWGWAEAYRRTGHAYYPKLLTAVPFTPSMGPRLGTHSAGSSAGLARSALDAVQQLAARESLSGWHLLFPDAALQDLLAAETGKAELLTRQDIQFHWHNRGFGSFEDFLASLRHSRRKTLRRERRGVAEQGVSMERRAAADIRAADWADFYQCYVATYLRRSGHPGYLNRDFFERLLADMREQLLLVTARRGGRTVASALFLFDDETLYGRYWGSLEDVRFLHFETCFYQGIEFCIERGIQTFDPGTQGEHKLLRGFEPVTTSSHHWIADARFRTGISDYLEREREATERYGEHAEEYLPYRRDA